jgi:hypothetical protein
MVATPPPRVLASLMVWHLPYLEFLEFFTPKSLCIMNILRKMKFQCYKLLAGS